MGTDLSMPPHVVGGGPAPDTGSSCEGRNPVGNKTPYKEGYSTRNTQGPTPVNHNFSTTVYTVELPYGENRRFQG